MKICFVHLSDIHCSGQCNPDSIVIEKTVVALREIGEIDEFVLLFTGDLSKMGQKDEFDVFEKVILKFQKEMKSLYGKDIRLFIVPGNHDLDLSIDNRGFDEINKWLRSHEMDEKFYNELRMLSNFWDCSQKFGCFENEKVSEKQIIELCGKRVQINLLNSAPFSTKEMNDKELHYLPEVEVEKITRDDDIDLHITLSHHNPEWFFWRTKNMLETRILRNSDILFLGHEHISKNVSLEAGTREYIEISKGGKFSLNPNNESVFNVLVYDATSDFLEMYTMEWKDGKKKAIFICNKVRENKNIRLKSNTLTPSSEFIRKLLSDEHGLSNLISDYFVFPKLAVKNDGISIKREKIISEEVFFEELLDIGIINITGAPLSGKTALLKFIYNMSVKNGYSPLFIGNKDYRGENIEKFVQNIFEEQYGEDKTDWHDFWQREETRRIIFIDDFDKIHCSSANNLLDYLGKKGLLVISTHDNFECNLTEVVKNAIKKRDVSILKIPLFLKEKREKLVSKICGLSNINSAELDRINSEINYLAQRGAGLFVLSPETIIQCVKFFTSKENKVEKGTHIFNVIFETNIRNAIIDKVKGHNVQTYLTVLEEMAYSMYFELRKEAITPDEVEEIVKKYNKEHKANVNAKSFCDSICEAQIIRSGTTVSFAISFTNKNNMAYFVAKKLSRKLERDGNDTAQIEYLVKNICFGINDTILLFLSYIRSNPLIISIFEKATKAILSEYEKLDFDANNVPFLKENCKDDTKIPTQDDKKHYDDHMERVEQEKQEEAIVKYKDIFDYDEQDADKRPYRIARAFKCLEILGKSLVSQHSILLADEKESIVNTMYEVPNQLLYAILKPYSDNFDKIIIEIEKYADSLHLKEKISREDIKHFLSDAALMLALNVYDNIALCCTDSNTIENLEDYPIEGCNKTIQNLIMCENARNSKTFIDKSTKICENTDDYFLKYLVKLVARKHILTTPSLKYDQRDKLSAKIFSGKSKEILMWSRMASK